MTTANQTQLPGRIRFNSKIALCAMFCGIFGTAVSLAAFTFPPEAAQMPLMVGGVGLFVSVLRLIIEVVQSRQPFEERVDLHKDVPMYLWVWAFVLAIVFFGFLFAAPPMLFLYLKLRSRESLWISLGLSGGVLALLYGLFHVVLSVELWEGLWTPTIMDWLLPS